MLAQLVSVLYSIVDRIYIGNIQGIGDLALAGDVYKRQDGPYAPSSETPMHTAVYRARPDVGAVVHNHALFCTVMAMAVDELPPSTPPQALSLIHIFRGLHLCGADVLPGPGSRPHR